MIKFAATKNGRTLMGLGLARRNIELLMAGKPILVDGEKLNLPFDVMILYGETEMTIVDELKAVGVELPPAQIDPGSDNHDDSG
jgi:hypothetical protein